MRFAAIPTLILLTVVFSGHAAKRPVSIDDVMSMKQVGRAIISPDGSRAPLMMLFVIVVVTPLTIALVTFPVWS